LIIITGDSWSADRPGMSLQTEHFYPVRNSLGQRLQKKLDKPVINLAQVGSNDLLAAENVLRSCHYTDRDTLESVSIIIWGWTDWTRCLPHIEVEDYPRPVPVEYTGDYFEDLAEVQRGLTENIREIENLLPSARFLHWGGHGSVLRDCVKDRQRHCVLFSDYAAERVGSPQNSKGLLSHSRPLDPNKLWPRSNSDVHDAVSKQAEKIVDFKQTNTKQFPDCCHLAFEYYDWLEEKIICNLTQQI